MVTGASGGLGGAPAQALADRGAAVLAADINVEVLRRFETNRSIQPIAMNLADADNIARVVEASIREHGGIDVLAHAAIRHFAGDGGDRRQLCASEQPRLEQLTTAAAQTGVAVASLMLGDHIYMGSPALIRHTKGSCLTPARPLSRLPARITPRA